MIAKEFLDKLGFPDSQITYIIDSDNVYGDIIQPISEEYMSSDGSHGMIQYESDEDIERLHDRTVCSLNKIYELCVDCDNKYILNLLFWLRCIPFAQERYKRVGIADDVFFDTMSDLVYKTRECKNIHGKCGVFTDWFFHIFDLRLFKLGRLEYVASFYRFKSYEFENYKLEKGDLIFECHIPSSGKLAEELCMDSLHRAYEFYKDMLHDSILPVACRSWLLYLPYTQSVFPPDSNMSKFASMFDITETMGTGRKFSDCERIFNQPFNGSTEGFLADNTLRRNFIEYINSGAEFGAGVGIILYDGEKRKIINRK